MANFINISEKHKCFLWMPPKTGTSHATFILKHFEFNTCGYENEELTGCQEFRQTHNVELFPGHSYYSLICTARNPFTMYTSFFRFNNSRTTDKISVENFREFFEGLIEKNYIVKYFSEFDKRMPDYFLRVEHLWHDYNKIRFVRESKLNKSGLLYDLCHKKINVSPTSDLERKFYTKDMIDYMMSVGKNYFDRLGYSYPY